MIQTDRAKKYMDSSSHFSLARVTIVGVFNERENHKQGYKYFIPIINLLLAHRGISKGITSGVFMLFSI